MKLLQLLIVNTVSAEKSINKGKNKDTKKTQNMLPV